MMCGALLVCLILLVDVGEARPLVDNKVDLKRVKRQEYPPPPGRITKREDVKYRVEGMKLNRIKLCPNYPYCD